MQIMKNCLHEIKRDIQLRKSKSFTGRQIKPSRHQSAVDIRKDANEDQSNISMISNQLNLADKYDLVAKFLSHEQILEKLSEIIDADLGKSEVFMFPESNQIRRDISDLKSIRINSSKPKSTQISTTIGSTIPRTRSKFFRASN